MRSEPSDEAITWKISDGLAVAARFFAEADDAASAREGRSPVRPLDRARRGLDATRRLVEQLSREAHRAELRTAIHWIESRDKLGDAAQAAATVGDLARRIGIIAAVPTEADVEEPCVEGGVQRVGRCVTWLVGCAAHLLPAADQARYREEFEAELLELAQGAGLRQLSHAVRLLVRALPLRWELRRPAKERVR
jgi:hypothetical protein